MKAEFTVMKWSNNLGVRMPADIAASVRLAADPRVQVPARGDAIVVGPEHRQRDRLDALLRGITAQDKHDATGFGTPVDQELP